MEPKGKPGCKAGIAIGRYAPHVVGAAVAALVLGMPGCSDADRATQESVPERHSSTIVFDNDTEDIWRVAPDGSQLHRLTTAPAQEFDPSLSPDAARIAYRSEVDGNSEIYVMDVDGTHAQNVTRNPASDYSPSWSPVGDQIAFASDRDGGRNDIYVMDADGSHVRQVTTDPSTDEYPTWSPDGSQLAFVSDRDGRWEIYLIDLRGSSERRLTRSGGKAPAWSPRGDWIAFEGPAVAGGDEHSGSIWLITPAGDDAHRVVAGFTPAWAPTADGLVGATGRGLAIVGLDGALRRYVAPRPALNPSWVDPGRS